MWRGGGNGEPELLASCYRASLELARAHAVRSIAFPAISTGILGYPIPAAAEVAAASVTEELRTTPDAFAEVLFVCFDEAATAIYATAVGAKRGSPA